MNEESFHASADAPSIGVVEALLRENRIEFDSTVVPFKKHSGIDNHLYTYSLKGTKFLLRVSSAPNAQEVHQKEFVCAKRARSQGVQTLEYTQLGSFAEYSFLCREFIEQNFQEQVALEKSWYGIAKNLKILHTIQADSFGCIGAKFIDQELNSAKQISLSKWLENEIDKIQNDKLVLSQGLLSNTELEKALKLVSEINKLDMPAVLCHGDASLGNILVSRNGEVFLIDWGNAIAHLGLHFDVAEISTWQRCDTWKEPFVQAYGITISELEEVIQSGYALQLWRILWALRRDISRMPSTWEKAPYAKRSVSKLEELKKLVF